MNTIHSLPSGIGLSLAILSLAAAGKAGAEAPGNDAFAAAAPMTPAAAVSVQGTTVDATREAEEPVYTYSARSVWYSWTAPAAGWKKVSIVTNEATVNNIPTVSVLTGASPAVLRLVSVDPAGGKMTRFEAVPGTKYYFHVNELRTPGQFTLSISDTTPPAAPANDNFSAAVTLDPALPRTVAGTFLDASVEAREPNTYDFGLRASVWYRWTAPAEVNWLDVYLTNLAEAAGVKLYTGSSLESLQLLAPRFADLASPESFYQVTPGTAYLIQVYQDLAATSPFILHLEAMSPPAPGANDSFASRVNLGNGAQITSSGSTDNATTETGEPLPVRALTSTVWYSWTAPATGAVEIKASGGSSQDTFLSVYTGDTLNALSLKAYNDDANEAAGDYNSRLVIPVTAGTVYQIQVGSAYAAWDAFSLTINPADADLQPFRVLNFTASASSVDVSSGPSNPTFDVTFSDPVSNPADLYLSLALPANVPAWGGVNTGRTLRGQGAAVPVFVSGTTYRFTAQLPMGLPPGDYSILLDAYNVSGGFADGRAYYGGTGGVALPGAVSAVSVVNTAAVTPAPVLTSFTMTPSAVDTTAGDADVAITVNATGVPVTEPVLLTLTDALGALAPLAVPELTHDGTSWKAVFKVRKGTKPQVLHPTVTLRNAVQGRDFGYANTAAASLPAAATTGLTIANTAPDRLPPQVLAFTLDTEAVSLAAGSYVLSGTMRVVDENTLTTLTLGVDDGFQTLYPELVQARLSGTAQDGVYRWSLLIDRFMPDGIYYMAMSPADGAGNTFFYNPDPAFGSWPAGLAFRFTIAHSGEDSAESKWMDAQDFTGIPGDDDYRLATGINADPDRDGLPNLLEFYFGTNPADPRNTTGAAALPVFSWTGTELRLDFGVSAANLSLGSVGSTLTGQFSTDLSQWSSVPVTTPEAGRGRTESPAPVGTRGFLRLQAIPQP